MTTLGDDVHEGLLDVERDATEMSSLREARAGLHIHPAASNKTIPGKVASRSDLVADWGGD